MLDKPKDLVGFYAIQLKMRCFEESGSPEHLKTKEQLFKEVRFWCSWLVVPRLRELIIKPLIETLRLSPSTGKKVAIPIFIVALEGDDKDVKRNAISILDEIGQADPEAVIPALTEALQDEDGYVRYSAVKALGEVGRLIRRPLSPLLSKLFRMVMKTSG